MGQDRFRKNFHLGQERYEGSCEDPAMARGQPKGLRQVHSYRDIAFHHPTANQGVNVNTCRLCNARPSLLEAGCGGGDDRMRGGSLELGEGW